MSHELVEARPACNLANVLEQQTLKWIFVGGKVSAGPAVPDANWMGQIHMLFQAK